MEDKARKSYTNGPQGERLLMLQEFPQTSNTWKATKKCEYTYTLSAKLASEIYSFWNGFEWKHESRVFYNYDSVGGMFEKRI